MTTEHEPTPDRRTSPRITPKGSAIISAPTWSRRGRITNLSATGMELALDDALAPCSDALAISVRLDGADHAWHALAGRLLRTDGGTVAIAFDRVPPAFMALLDTTARASRTHDRRISVVLVDPQLARRSTIAEGFRAAGCSVLDVSTPLEAIVRLGESEFEPDVIAIADSHPEASADQLRTFVEREHPAAQLVRIGDAAAPPADLAQWLSSAGTADALLTRIRQVLGAAR